MSTMLKRKIENCSIEKTQPVKQKKGSRIKIWHQYAQARYETND